MREPTNCEQAYDLLAGLELALDEVQDRMEHADDDAAWRQASRTEDAILPVLTDLRHWIAENCEDVPDFLADDLEEARSP